MYWSDQDVNEEHRKDLMRRAEDYRRAQAARQNRTHRPTSRFYRPLVVRMGRQMVSWGSYLVRSQDEPLSEQQAMPRGT